jgi:hypothetical protein
MYYLNKMMRTNEALWTKIKNQVRNSNVAGTQKGLWSARKAQLAVRKYKSAGGSYRGPKSFRNSLVRWTNQHWTTKSGRPSHVTGERYLPSKAIKALSASQYRRTSNAKRFDTLRGRQYSRQPSDVRSITKKYRT